MGNQRFEQVAHEGCVISILDYIQKSTGQNSEQNDLVALVLSKELDDYQN